MSRWRALATRVALGTVRRIDGRTWVPLHPFDEASAKEPRWGWHKGTNPHLHAALERARDRYIEQLQVIEGFGAELAAIAREEVDPLEPTWGYAHFRGLDGASMYSLVRSRRPARMIEIGSGNSTRFAARAIRDGGLQTHLTSIDPEPRREIDALCDRIIRQPLQDVDPAVFSELQPGDLLFLDGSHKVSPGNDVTVFFLEILPSLPDGVIVGVHDVYLPDDYPTPLLAHMFTEHYLPAVALLAPRPQFDVLLACHYFVTDPPLWKDVHDLWKRIGLGGEDPYGCTLWLETRSR